MAARFAPVAHLELSPGGPGAPAAPAQAAGVSESARPATQAVRRRLPRNGYMVFPLGIFNLEWAILALIGSYSGIPQ